MAVIDFILAISPIAIVLIGILAFDIPAMKIAPWALIWTIFLALTIFNIGDLSLRDNVAVLDPLVWKGIKEGFKIVMMVFGAFVILNILKKTGAIEDVKNTVTRISGKDRRVQLIVIGFLVPIFLEGAAGAGAPAAIASPFLVALGFNPVTAVAASLLGDATPCSWGGAGLTTITGGAALVDAGISTNALNSAMVGHFNSVAAIIIPFLIIMVGFGRKGFKGIIPYLTYTGLTTGAVMFFLSNYIGPEITSMGTGLIGILLSVLYVKLIPIKTPKEYEYEYDTDYKPKYSSLAALSPYLFMLILLPAVRYGVPAIWPVNGFANLTMFGYIVWVDVVILICGVLGALVLRLKFSDLGQVYYDTFISVLPVLVTMGSLLMIAYIMQSDSTGMMSLVANDIAAVFGRAYPAAAVVIGAMGSFITGTGVGSNIMFAGMHMEASAALGLNPIVVFAGQNAAGSLGNLICPNNTVAACATVDLVGHENQVMYKTIPSFLVILVLYMILSLLYTLVIYPDFGM